MKLGGTSFLAEICDMSHMREQLVCFVSDYSSWALTTAKETKELVRAFTEQIHLVINFVKACGNTSLLTEMTTWSTGQIIARVSDAPQPKHCPLKGVTRSVCLQYVR